MNRRFYEDHHAAGHYGQKREASGYRTTALLRQIGRPNTNNYKEYVWLDLGCGAGNFMREIHALSIFTVKGADLVPFSKEITECSLAYGQLPFDANSFGVVSCNHVLEHIFGTEHVLREAHRILTPKGVFVLSVPNHSFWPNRIFGLFGWSLPWCAEFGVDSVDYGKPGFMPCQPDHKPSGHIRSFTPNALIDLCKACGFVQVGWWRQEAGWKDWAPPKFRANLAMIFRKIKT